MSEGRELGPDPASLKLMPWDWKDTRMIARNITQPQRSEDTLHATLNAVLNDEDLSLKAKGLMATIIAGGGDVPSIADIARESSDGKHAIRTAIAELVHRDYLARLERFNSNGIQTSYTLELVLRDA